jgi:hypothetical protein
VSGGWLFEREGCGGWRRKRERWAVAGVFIVGDFARCDGDKGWLGFVVVGKQLGKGRCDAAKETAQKVVGKGTQFWGVVVAGIFSLFCGC